ncbi:NAD(P)-dependent dehydrogenase (short-subunit alcohol dehydrogenase family) [Lachnospiraceae bacterium PF1-21]|uniref:SDR family oxidoreductase n=1 Tax=Ohessyouella blattaphilus TaxID=2949333 RepID=A0ABT1EE94_9FIRM|nr:SDR family oxidoreductase [Ohessyouella blattaphilus]MCP1109031.1 SDR family oxidoreductase [Ohessyouella blattaphilus]MCR8562425.1 SDR family oxidoreductase [Ohessyouella blattaphilus]
MGIMEKMRLDGKAIYVTGGARGIGKSVATGFAEAGADLAIVDVDIAEAEKTAKEIAEKNGVKTIAIKCDVTDPDDVKAMVAKVVETFGKLDVAFNNAGICINEPAEEMSYEAWMKVININLNGVFLTAQAAGQVMLKQGYGSIINTASMSGHIVNVPQPQCAYNASKAGVIMLTKSMAVEWAKKNVRVNCISPGYIGTELISNDPKLKPLVEEWNKIGPMGRIGKPEELQGICVYLAGDSSPFTTGSDFIVDGAFTSF